MPKQEHVRVSVLDVMGREVATVLDAEMEAGDHQMSFDLIDQPSGVYEVWLRAGDMSQRARMIKTR